MGTRKRAAAYLGIPHSGGSIISPPPTITEMSKRLLFEPLIECMRVFVKAVSTQLLLGVATFEKGDGGSVRD
jgi:hypothetical protein